MYFACEFKHQNRDIFINMGKKLFGPDEDRAIGKMTVIKGKGF